MIHYININKKRLVGRNNQPNNLPLAIDFHTLGTIDFAFINDCNQIKPINENLKFYLAGSKKMNKEASKLLFLSKTYTIKDNVITFTVDTYTQPFIEEITKKNTEINVEISAEADNAQQVLLRDIAYANPRVYVPGFTPPPVDPTEYYTKDEVDNLLNDYQPVSGMANYALKSDIPSGGSGGGYTFPYETRTFLCASESVEADGTILIQMANDNLYTQSGNRQINNVVIIPSGAPSGKVDFVYEEVSGFVYNPFTTVKFQLDCIPTKEYPTLQEIQFLIEKAGEETIIATTEGLSSKDILRYNGQNDNSLFCSQVIALKNILNKEFVSVINDKVKLRFIFAYQYFGTSNQRNAPSDQKQQFTVGRNSVDNGYYSFFLSINKDFENPDLLDRLKYDANQYGVALIENIFDHLQIRYPVDSLQNRNLAFMLNDTGIFGKAQNASYAYDEYHYHFNNYIDYSQDYSLYDDIYLNGKFDSRR